jgi:hypothetical protein
LPVYNGSGTVRVGSMDDPRLSHGGLRLASLDRTAGVVHEIGGHAAAVCLLFGMLLLRM